MKVIKKFLIWFLKFILCIIVAHITFIGITKYGGASLEQFVIVFYAIFLLEGTKK